ncbi:MAG TPA: 16S rRNA (adenine(1518)-N(6)/adenine(1519)-N(6))-dimethyltransferase RsmA [Gemmatimonadales bacterium]|nr:16S rRNA (adenine(1518)-N(6)/adenine(1519)-N(6))-dimethyltransferase RsmA [Gemmatimonadales bacterium]
MRARKRFGQHFLHHQAILERIVGGLAPEAGGLVLEIGPGQGALTEVLVRHGARVTAIEKDRDLAPLVRERLPGVRVIEGDALKLDWREAAGALPGEPLLVTGNIPYNITTPLLAKALIAPLPQRIVFLVQEEVADRLAAEPGTREYGALSVGVQAQANVEKLFKVGAGAFHPKPQVDSAVVRITPLTPTPTLTLSLRPLATGLFSYRRKQLSTALRHLTGWPAERVGEAIRQAGLDPAQRPETLTPDHFIGLLRVLIDGGWPPG